MDRLEKLVIRNDLTVTGEAKELYDMIENIVDKVYSAYGSDIYRELVYTAILGVELEELGYQTKREEKYTMQHKGKDVGLLIADLVVSGAHSFVVEAKKIDINKAIRQVIGYMRVANLDYGFVVGYLRGSSEIWMVLRGVLPICILSSDVMPSDISDKRGECIVYYMYNRGVVKEIPTTGII